MCCRIYIERENVELAAMADAANRTKLRDSFFMRTSLSFRSAGEITPGTLVPVIARSRNGRRGYFPMVWGYHVDRNPILINARSETAAEKPTFQPGWQAHRCVIPASYYYEWEHFIRPNGKKETGQKYLIQPRNERITWLCGIYRMEDGLPHFVILTRSPSDEIAFIHDRMPLIIREQDIDRWINPDVIPEEIASRAVTDLYFEKVV